jgi:regulator of sigma E protease
VKLVPKAKDWETEYGIGWCPLGGYCKINGMIDESLDLETMRQEPKDWEFRTKPAWQRLLVMFGGVLFNFITAIIIFSSILAVQGRSYIRNQGNKIYVNEVAREMGFRNGDEILLLDGRAPVAFNDLQADIARKGVRKATVLRGTDTLDIYIDQAMIGEIVNGGTMFELAVPFVIEQFQEDSQNAGCGLVKGDRILAFNGQAFDFVQDCREILAVHKGETIEATYLRGADTLACNVKVDTLGQLGVALQIPGVEYINYSALAAIPAGIKYTWEMIVGYVDDLKLVATPSTQAYKSVGSFIAIGQVFPSVWDWNQFLNIMAMLSIMLGVMNLLPIPGLDGGHILFTLYEMVTRRKPSDRFMVVAQMVGMVLLFALMFLAFGNDIARLIK